MLITSIFLICIGWVLGVHLPWFMIMGLVAILGICACNTSDCLTGIFELLLIVAILVPMVVAGFIYGDVTFVDIGETIKYLFTGG